MKRPALEHAHGLCARSCMLDAAPQAMLEGHYPLGFKLALHHKDLGIALDAASALNLQLPVTELPPNMELLEFSADERKAALDAGPLDWVEKGAVTAPTSQGRCATCAYFAGVAAVEGAWKLAGHPLVKLSEQEEIDW